jgi:hypothetical protein
VDAYFSNASNPLYEQPGNTGPTFPTTNTQPIAKNSYDAYDVSYTSQGLPNEGAAGSPKGQLTRTEKLILGTTNWLTSYLFYDNDSRPIQVRSNNHLNSSTNDLVTASYDFEGKITSQKISQDAGNGNVTTAAYGYGYDHMGRTTGIWATVTQPIAQTTIPSNQWSNIINLTANGNRLTKTGGTNVEWDGGRDFIAADTGKYGRMG